MKPYNCGAFGWHDKLDHEAHLAEQTKDGILAI